MIAHSSDQYKANKKRKYAQDDESEFRQHASGDDPAAPLWISPQTI